MGKCWAAVMGGAYPSWRFSGKSLATALVMVCLSLVAVPLKVEAGGYRAALEAATLVAQGKLTVETNVSATVNNSRLGLPYRTAYHFQPKSHWMNDPNGPVYYKGYYHLFYQYNPEAAIPGTIEWGHVVSKDLIHWEFLEPAIKRDKWYDLNGCWSGSITLLDNGNPVIFYTGNSVNNTQAQCRADPEDPSDPLLRKWVKAPYNPFATTPPGFNTSQFRDPTTAWKGVDGVWRILVGASYGPGNGIDGGSIGTNLLFKSTDFIKWNYTHIFHQRANTGMWECPDFYPVNVTGKKGLEPSVDVGPNVKHVLKISSDVLKHDFYSVGTYFVGNDTYSPNDPQLDTSIGLRYDYGKYYASKTFFDQKTQRRILYGWTNESDSTLNDVEKGWAGLQSLPRQIWLNCRTPTDLLQWPIEEVDQLRHNKVTVKNVTLKADEVAELMDVAGVQLDLEVSFEIPDVQQGATPPEVLDNTGDLICSQKGAAMQGMYGPFGVLVLATDDRKEQTAVYFYFVYSKQNGWKTLVCSDQSRSTVSTYFMADKTTYGSYVRLYEDDKYLTLRLLVDHSVVETFAQGGRTVITSRVYPEYAQANKAHVFLFNNGSQPVTVSKVDVWSMGAVKFVDFQQ